MKLSIQLFLVTLTLFMACAKSPKPIEPVNTPPNIVIIFTDDQGYNDVGCYGSPNIKTPHLDQMAKDGVRFTNFYVSQPVCSASRASLLTGCYANRIGVHGAFMPYVGKGLNTNEVTIAEMLKPLGYTSGIYGKWHLGSETQFLPTKQGFDDYFGIPYSNDMWPYHPGQGKNFNFKDLPLFQNETIIDTLEDQSLTTRWYTEHAVDFIETNKDKPFFLYVPHSQPHVPLYVSDRFSGTSDRGLYGDVISEIDWSVGEIIKTLKTNGLEENTMIIFASDNGPWLNYGNHSGTALPLREGKGTALEGGVRVPCIVKWPESINSNQTISAPAMTIDILPTIAEITGASLPKNTIDGRSMLTLLKTGDAAAPHHPAYYFYYHQNALQAVMSGNGRWKLYLPHKYRSIEGREGRDDGLPIEYNYQVAMGLELYDLRSDISETTNVYDQYPDIVEALMKHVEAARSELGDALTEREGTGNRSVGFL
ncbi:MAG: arylsulfatase A-like enzyme [Saprospiraceae bacterium]|jgi:arylsulfatase A-like enzyme